MHITPITIAARNQIIIVISSSISIARNAIKLSPALTELNEAVENAKKYQEYLSKLKKARDEENGV